MTLRMPIAALAAALFAILLVGGFMAQPASAHQLPEPPAAADVDGVGPAQLEPVPDDADQGWILFAAIVFVIFAALGLVFAVFGYLEATRRE